MSYPISDLQSDVQKAINRLVRVINELTEEVGALTERIDKLEDDWSVDEDVTRP